MRLNKKFTINKYINMKCCWRSVAVSNIENSIKNELDEISIVNQKYLNFDINKYPHELLGSGHYGECYKIIMNDKEYTCKKIKYLKNTRFSEEVNVLKDIKNGEYLPELFVAFSNLEGHYILYDYIPGKDLFQYLKNGFFPLNNKKKVLVVIKQINNALFELFNNNYAHLDIKLENIILTNEQPIKVKLIDLESCKKINSKKKTAFCGTIGYASPEMILQHRYYYNTDIWSLGVILFMLYTHDNFFKPAITEKLKNNYLKFFETFSKDYIKNRLLDNNSFDEEIFELLSAMLQKLHVNRISIHGLKKHKLLLEQDN